MPATTGRRLLEALGVRAPSKDRNNKPLNDCGGFDAEALGLSANWPRPYCVADSAGRPRSATIATSA